ncbi:MAG: methyltransferase [Ghiorsea sp.]|nr:methyltransferase [Ghiorsea sp.]
MPKILNGTIEKVISGGDGIVRQQNNTILIPNTVAGDSITYAMTDKKRGVWRANLEHILTPSQDRVLAPCPIASDCGGCALQYMHRHTQAELKTTWVVDAFQHFITPATNITPITPHPEGFAGRRRVRWFVLDDKLGFRKRFSHDIVPTDACIALTANLNHLRHTLEAMPLPSHVQSVQAVELSNGTHIILESPQDKPTDFVPDSINDTQWWWRNTQSSFCKALHKPALTLWDSIAFNQQSHININIGPNDFVQGHAEGNQALISQIIAWSQGAKRVVDLFSGCGNLSLPLAKALGAKVLGAELNPASVKAANANAKRLKLNATYQMLDLFGHFPTESFIGADILILDPPRKGAKRICQNIRHFFPKQIIMVHCDIAAGARDAQALVKAGFRLKALRPLDLFPYTGHVEVLSLWEL